MHAPQDQPPLASSPAHERGLTGNALFPNHYAWYLLASTLDIVFTFIIIEIYAGSEANKAAAHVFDRFGWPGMIALKFATVLIVITVCEIVGRKNEPLARLVASLAVVVGALPVLLAFFQVRAMFG